jgi:hypothetical protein
MKCPLTLLVAIVIAGCGGGESAKPHAPGEIERLSNATIYHLKNGVFVHEAFEGADHYYLLHDIVESYELTQDGLKYVKKTSAGTNAGTTPRPPVGEILCILRESDSSSLVTKLRGDEATIKRVIESFNADATVESVRNMTRRPTAQHVARFRHGHADAGTGGVSPRRVEGKPFYGFDGTNFTSCTRLDGSETAVNFQFRLLDSRDGKDIYKITRTITDTQARGNFGRIESKGKPITVTIEYAGGKLVVFDDEYGVAKFMPLSEAKPNQDADLELDLPEVEVDREPGKVEPELRQILPNRKANP